MFLYKKRIFRKIMQVTRIFIVLAVLLVLVPFASATLIWKVSTRGSHMTGGIIMTAQEAPIVKIAQPNGTTIAGPARISNGVLDISEPAIRRPASCVSGTTWCEDNVFVKCVGGVWVTVEKCKNSEVCTPDGCKMFRWSRYPYVKITPPTKAPVRWANITRYEMHGQVGI